MAIADADALELDRRFVLCVEHPEAGPMVAHRGVQLDWDVHQTERDGAFPEGAGHKELVSW
jgi:hypothetical protein